MGVKRGNDLSDLTAPQRAYLQDSRDLIDALSDWDLYCLNSYRMGVNSPESGPSARELWARYGHTFLTDHVRTRPGTRPVGWWAHEAPRLRRRISGQGKLRQGYWPAHSRGILAWWEADSLDPDDPLLFESEASYLQRLNLLLQHEEKKLNEGDFEHESLQMIDLSASRHLFAVPLKPGSWPVTVCPDEMIARVHLNDV